MNHNIVLQQLWRFRFLIGLGVVDAWYRYLVSWPRVESVYQITELCLVTAFVLVVSNLQKSRKVKYIFRIGWAVAGLAILVLILARPGLYVIPY